MSMQLELFLHRGTGGGSVLEMALLRDTNVVVMNVTILCVALKMKILSYAVLAGMQTVLFPKRRERRTDDIRPLRNRNRLGYPRRLKFYSSLKRLMR